MRYCVRKIERKVIQVKAKSVKVVYNPEKKPGAYFWPKHFLLGLFSRGLIFGVGGLIFWMKFALKKGVGLLFKCIFLQQYQKD